MVSANLPSKTVIDEISLFTGEDEGPSGAAEFRGRRRSIPNHDKRRCAVLDFHGIDVPLERAKHREQTRRNYIRLIQFDYKFLRSLSRHIISEAPVSQVSFTRELAEQLKFLSKCGRRKPVRKRKRSVETIKSDSTGL